MPEGHLKAQWKQYPVSKQYMQEAKQLVRQVYKKATGGKKPIKPGMKL